MMVLQSVLFIMLIGHFERTLLVAFFFLENFAFKNEVFEIVLLLEFCQFFTKFMVIIIKNKIYEVKFA